MCTTIEIMYVLIIIFHRIAYWVVVVAGETIILCLGWCMEVLFLIVIINMLALGCWLVLGSKVVG